MSSEGKTWKQESTKQWEKFAHHCLTGGLEKFQKEMATLSGKDYVQSFLMMLKFVKPQFASVQLTGDEGKTLMQPIINVIQLPGQPPMALQPYKENPKWEDVDLNINDQTIEGVKPIENYEENKPEEPEKPQEFGL